MAEAGARRPFFRRRKSCPFTGPNAPKSSGHREPPGWQLPGRPQCRDGMSTAASLLASSWPERHARSDSSATATPTSGHCRWALETVILLGRKWHPPATDHPASIVKCGGQWLQSCRCRKARRFDRGFSLGGPGETPGREWPAPLH